MTCADIPSATSLPESADGHTPCDSQNGPMTDLFGQVVAPANHSLAQVRGAGCGGMTTDIFGPFGKHSSLNANLALSLESKLPQQGIGLMKYAMTWRAWGTPLGRQFCRLQVSVLTMRELGCTLLATPTATANQDAPSMRKHLGCLGIEVSQRSWRARMGYPVEWAQCAPMAMPSCRPSRKNSSKRA